MDTVTFRVPNISCGHCVMTVERALKDGVAGVGDVAGDPAAKQVTVAFAPPATIERIVAVMTECGYAPEP